MTVSRLQDDVSSKAMEGVMTLAESPSRVKSLLTNQMDEALARHDNQMVNQLLDNAMAHHLLGPQAPSIIRSAAQQQAKRQLREAIDSGDPKRLKGSLVAAKRLNATDLPEFQEAVAKYKEVRKLPLGWDVSLMVLHREGARMVAKLELEDPNVRARFQRLLDLTHRKVYTRDRMGEPVPERPVLQLSSFKNLYDENYANCNITFFRESQNAGRERFAKAPRKNPRRTAWRKLSRKSNFLCMSCCLCG
ncbi:unnamed protein product [Durusdinium trenchii]|uniref:Uncharacterized protein n=1 Tax=Durusdinium trenchii TaxID=1381693 RepID=A0ABP0M1W7_9DINO